MSSIKAGIFGLVVGDALGVPVEFKKREQLKINPVKEMLGYMSWNQPPGTWSDDSSLTLCLVEQLSKKYDIEQLGKLFVKWYKFGHWSAHGKLFDIGGTTRHSLNRIVKGDSAYFSGDFFEEDNGNGSLMRILPLAFFLEKEEDLDYIYTKVKEVSSITHAHFRSVFACFIYIVFALELLKKKDKIEAYQNMKIKAKNFLKTKEFNPNEIKYFERILNSNINDIPENEIDSSGYVLHSLEASLWCFLTTETYSDAVLKAVNLGGDTDTTGAITGGIAGIYYGFESIPEDWIDVLARKQDIEDVCEKLREKIKNNTFIQKEEKNV